MLPLVIDAAFYLMVGVLIVLAIYILGKSLE